MSFLFGCLFYFFQIYYLYLQLLSEFLMWLRPLSTAVENEISPCPLCHPLSSQFESASHTGEDTAGSWMSSSPLPKLRAAQGGAECT